MDNSKLQNLVEDISQTYFGKPFNHIAVFNPKLRTTGGRYLLKSHNIELNYKYFEEHGMTELIAIIKHELCHYHLHIDGKGYQHKDRDFKFLLQKVGGSRYCTPLKKNVPRQNSTIKLYECTECKAIYKRKRKVDVARYVCGKCKGKLKQLK
ncbi:SprT family protein [Bacillus sp. FJAT-49736]|uniref:SprT family protein n=1 Tax=Bacillus sp. FJAT-49736 TaxID=2833582 RepID=UPI001BC959CA|nr:SprT family protein [Bacillus sp. FJAT-49736]MBS4175502.1 SprT family protein [Bacillus sp. FJAT-49736]